MSRSNPTDNLQNPAKRWFEWDGANGGLKFYDKELASNVSLEGKPMFLVLDILSTIKGWHDASDSGIFSNEVRDTRTDVLVVKSFKGGDIANGLYANIRDKVKANGGKFVANIYCGMKIGNDGLSICSIQFKGAAFSAWAEFVKAHRGELYKKAIVITGSTQEKKGATIFHVPVFAMKDVSPETEATAIELDKELQSYLSVKLTTAKSSPSEPIQEHPEYEPQEHPRDNFRPSEEDLNELDNAPF
jgi:hypothetical protein